LCHIEGQVNSGDWSTPSEYIRDLIRQDKERQLRNLDRELLAGVKSEKIEIPAAEIRRTGLVAAIRKRTRRK
jgi:antitoxin ParD1/3/4